MHIHSRVYRTVNSCFSHCLRARMRTGVFISLFEAATVCVCVCVRARVCLYKFVLRLTWMEFR